MIHGASRFKIGCRCGVCRADHRRESREVRDRARERARLDPAIIPHGTTSGYTYWGCRCKECKARKAAPERRDLVILPEREEGSEVPASVEVAR